MFGRGQTCEEEPLFGAALYRRRINTDDPYYLSGGESWLNLEAAICIAVLRLHHEGFEVPIDEDAAADA